MKPEIAVFTQDNRCSKLHIWNCFAGKRGQFRRVTKPEALSIIGVNAPRNMLRQGYAEEQQTNNADYYVLTDKGKDWLRKGIVNYLKRHPQFVSEARDLPASIKSQL